MAKRTYPAMLEPTDAGFGVSFPDLPGCVSFGESAEEAIRNAEEALSLHLEGMAEDAEPFPEPAHLGDRMLERAAEPGGPQIIWAQITVEAPDAAERVNVYLPKSLLERVDAYATEQGINRSQFFVQAAKGQMNAMRELRELPTIASSIAQALAGQAAAVRQLGEEVGPAFAHILPEEVTRNLGDAVAAAARNIGRVGQLPGARTSPKGRITED